MTTFKLDLIAPRLARARDQQAAFLSRKKGICKVLEEKVDRLERLVIHRDLQYYRALARNKPKGYIDYREEKLRRAKLYLESAQKQLEKARKMS